MLAPLLVLGPLGRPLVAAQLWSRAQALATLHDVNVVQLGMGVLPRSCYEQLLADRAVIVTGLDECLRAATAQVARCAVEGGSGGWKDGRWTTSPLESSGAREAADSLLCLWEAARTDAWQLVQDDGAPSEAALALQEHLCASRGVLPQLGAAATVLRTVGFVHRTLLAAGLGGGAEYARWVNEHAARWEELARQCDAAFDASRRALDDGELRLALASALSDVECSVALREAQTAGALLHACVETAQCAEGGCDDAPVEAARAALEAVEPGHLASRDKALFVRGRGFLDGEARQGARREEARAYLAARQSVEPEVQ